MRRGSRKVSKENAGKSQGFDFGAERTQYSPSRRLVDYMTPVQRQAFIDEGNKAFQQLLARNKGFQAAARASSGDRPRQRPVLTLKTRPTRVFAALKGTVSAPVRRVVAVALDSAPTAQRLSEAVVCAKRKVRRELVFAEGGAGQRRNVPHRAAPSKVKC